MLILSFLSPRVISLILLPKRITDVHFSFKYSYLILEVHLIPLFREVTHISLFSCRSAEAEVNVANSLTVYPPRIKINFI